MPRGVDTRRLRFGWTLSPRDPTGRNLAQIACRVQVSQGWPGGAEVFDSGRIARSAMTLTPAQDLNLQPQAPYVWRVMVWGPERDAKPLEPAPALHNRRRSSVARRLDRA